jgi:hypothetical protein
MAQFRDFFSPQVIHRTNGCPKAEKIVIFEYFIKIIQFILVSQFFLFFSGRRLSFFRVEHWRLGRG